MEYISLHVDYLPVNMKNAAILEMWEWLHLP